jgi:hypothetical protein
MTTEGDRRVALRADELRGEVEWEGFDTIGLGQVSFGKRQSEDPGGITVSRKGNHWEW